MITRICSFPIWPSLLNDPLRAIRITAAARLAHLPIDKLDFKQRQQFENAMIEFRESEDLQLDHAGGHLSWHRSTISTTAIERRSNI